LYERTSTRTGSSQQGVRSRTRSKSKGVSNALPLSPLSPGQTGGHGFRSFKRGSLTGADIEVGQAQSSPIAIDVHVETRIDKESYSFIEEGQTPHTPGSAY
jgi:hypothetical protein